jgi:hypothetical protein
MAGALALFWGYRAVWDIDLGWHWALGRFIRENGWPTVDPLGAARGDRPWTTFQGGYELLVDACMRLGGFELVRAVHASVAAVGFALLHAFSFRLLRRQSWAWALTFLGFVLYEDRFRVRPEAFHFALVLAYLHALARPAQSWRHALWFAPVQSAWTLLHAPASLWGLALLGAGAVGEPRNRARWAALGASAAGLIASPHAIAGLRSAFSVHAEAGMQSQLVPEHWPLWAYLDAGLGAHGWLVVALCGVLLGVWATGAVLAATRSAHLARWPGPLWWASAGLALFSVALARFAWYALPAAAIGGAALRARLTAPSRAALWPTLALALWLSDAALYAVPRRIAPAEGPGPADLDWFPIRAVGFLEEEGLSGTIYTEPEWGGFVLGRLHPKVRSVTDGRIAFGAEVAALILRDTPAERANVLDALHDRFGVTLTLRRRGAFRLGPPQGWMLLYADARAEVWGKR